LLIAAQYTFEFRRKELEDDDGERLRLERQEVERARAQAIVDNIPPDITTPTPPAQEEEVEVPKFEDISQEDIDNEFDDEFGDIEELQKEAADQKKVLKNPTTLTTGTSG
jgi:hypothetical protein